MSSDPNPTSCTLPWRIPDDWPEPAPQAVALGERLLRLLGDQMSAGVGGIPFSRFMEQALYAPGLGYYSAGLAKFGADGDFVTAPELGSLFSTCLANSCADVLRTLGDGDVLEFGAGSGVMAADMLRELARVDCLPGRYLILERSAELRARQRETLESRVPDLLARVEWLDALPAEGVRGVIVANEVLDAMPVERVVWHDDGPALLHVELSGDALCWREHPATDADLDARLRGLQERFGLAPGYLSEIAIQLEPWVQSLSDCLREGAALLIDYGMAAHEYYHPQRAQGTLLCHYRQRAHANPLLLPGVQDITAQVDFTAVADAALASGLSVKGYTTQAHFLLENGLQEQLMETAEQGGSAHYARTGEAKRLTLPDEMGERFKCMALTRGLERPPSGFLLRDLRDRL